MICKILAENAMERTTEANVTKLKKTLIAQFDTRAMINKVETANLVLESLKQGKNKNLHSYYICTKRFLKEAGGQNFQETNLLQTFSSIKRSFLNRVIIKFISYLLNEIVMTRMF